jgi:hypothetical protein
MVPISVNPNVAFGHSEGATLTDLQIAVLQAAYDNAKGELSTVVQVSNILRQLESFIPEEIYRDIKYLEAKRYLKIKMSLTLGGESIPQDIEITKVTIEYIQSHQK